MGFLTPNPEFRSEQPLEIRCKMCDRNGSIKWWKCCPEHTTEQGGDVVCDACLRELHPIEGKEE